ncbi:NurA domain-containing protein [Thermoflavimicrobium dichotomicum]|uniref:NurA domain-containing protein n=1 Tax=Thermoflavimicrobium dichotomicum TaxID=46223 RepID=A0A1I3QNJ9_9BACL|nr:NurA domain-containing protein [Thermoflavimicrobium dichotomicum]
MLPVSEELKRKLKKVNESLRKIYPISNLDQTEIRERLSRYGKFYKIEKWKDDQLKDWLSSKTLVGVDGSVNSTKGMQTRTLSVFQALAKGTRGEEKWAADVFTPLLAPDEEEEEGQAAREAKERGKLLSGLELEVARFAIEHWHPKVVLMDGSLLHFYIDHLEAWMQVVEVAEKTGTLLVGVAEEIGTRSLVKEVFPELKNWSDRDLLYGVLQVGEAFEWEDWSPTGSQMWKMVLRSSRSPQPIGIDGLESQREYRHDLVRLIYTLTPEQGRGVPFWLDIVDNQVRVTDPLVETMVEQYIDPDLRHRLLVPKRTERVI